ncbi:MAG: tetratricopeptide repeat protein [Nannocystaceae bacterium]
MMQTKQDDQREGDPSSSAETEPRPALAKTRRPLPPELSPGEHIGRYAVMEPLGRGGMGTVYRAHDGVLGRFIAIKLLNSGTTDTQALRLKREAQALARLSHPNIVRVYEVGQHHERWFIAMELVDGQTLGRWRRGQRSWRECVEVYRQAGAGLAAAHAAGFVHRDFKPDNCIIDGQGRVRVLDFGLVRGPGTLPDESSLASQTTIVADVSITRTGALLGTLAYMALEQLEGNPVDPRTDQFAFCVALYEALYGQRPFKGKAVGSLTIALSRGEVQSAPRDTKVPARLRRVLLRGLSADPDERWPDMPALLEALRTVTARRRRRWAALIGATGVVAAAGIALALPDARAPCPDASTLLEGVWDDARRQEVEAAFQRSTLPYAPQTWERTQDALDEQARAWADQHAAICEATTVRSEQTPEVMDLRMGCLQQRRVELSEVVQLLAAANDTRVRLAVELVSSLPPLSRCADVEALRAQLPSPKDRQTAAEVQQLREHLAVVRSLTQATEYDRAFAQAELVDARAQQLGYAPLQAEARHQLGSLHAEQGRYAEAEQDLERAYLLAMAHGHEQLALEAAVELVFLVGRRRADPERGLWWSRAAQALIERLPEDPVMTSALLINIGTVLSDRGELDESLDHYQRAFDILQAVDARPIDIASARRQLGNGLMELGRLDEALVHFRQVLASLEDALGPQHPNLAKTLNNIGIVLLEQGKSDEALEHYRRSRDLLEATLGKRHPEVGTAWANLGNVLRTQGRADEALEHLEHAHVIWEESLGPEHPRVGELLANIGLVLESTGELERALQMLTRAALIMEGELGPVHPGVATILSNIGTIEAKLDRLDEATESLERAASIFEQSLGPRHPASVQPSIVLAEIALQREDRATARVRAERLVQRLESSPESAFELAYVTELLAKVMWSDASQRGQARALALEARDAFARLGEQGRVEADRVDAWLRAGAPPAPGEEAPAGTHDR